MAYTRGSSANIIVGAAALFTYEEGNLTDADLPTYVEDVSFRNELSGYEANELYAGSPAQSAENAEKAANFRNIGYTMNGLELAFQPDFGEVQVDQVLDVAKLYKQGMQVNLNTAFAEATLENLLVAIASSDSNLTTVAGNPTLNLSAGDIGECPVERGLVAVGPGTGDCAIGDQIERVYVAYRALSIENVTVSAKRDEPSMYEVSFRLLPNDSASYGKIVDRTIPAS